MAKGQKTGGRTKGTPNKVTQDVREAILDVAANLGGSVGMLRWAQSDPVNERIFWSQIYPKTLPKEVKQDITSNGQTIQGGALVVPGAMTEDEWEAAAKANGAAP
jgi:hypothetical protein